MSAKQLSVKALIEALSKLDPEAPVWYEGDGGYAEARGVEIMEHPSVDCFGVYIY